MSFLLCIVLVFQGQTIAHAFQPPCPMAGDDAATIASTTDVVHAHDDCCNDADTAARTGKLCKTDMPCGTSVVYTLPSLQFALPVSSAALHLPAPSAPKASFDPASVWRPPSLS